MAYVSIATDNGVNKYKGNSIDTKPSDVPNGSRCFETDTRRVWVYDSSHKNPGTNTNWWPDYVDQEDFLDLLNDSVNDAQLGEKANQTDLVVERGRIDNLLATPNISFYEKCLQTDTGALFIVSSGATTGQINLASVTPVATGYTPAVSDYVRLVYGLASGSSELIDARIGLDGVTYPSVGGAIRTQVNKLTSSMDGIRATSDNNLNVIDVYSQTVSGVECVVENGVITLNGTSGGSANHYIPLVLPAGTYYYYATTSAGTNTYFSLTDSSKTGLNSLTSLNSLTNSGSFTISGESSYLRIKADYSSGYNNFVIRLAISPHAITQYYPLGYVLNDNVLVPSLNIIEKSYHVGVGKEYSTFTACLEAVKNNTDKKTIYVHSGDYDIFAEIGGTTFINSIQAGASWRDVNTLIPNNTTIIGVGNVTFNYLPTSEQATVLSAGLISVLNCEGNIIIENITINCQNCRYGIHDESSANSLYNECSHIFKNVNINYLDGGVMGSPSGICFGCGFVGNEVFEFDNCKFIVNRASGGPLYMHNWFSTGINGSVISFSNCIMKNVSSNATALQFGNSHGNTTVTENKVSVNNSYLFGTITVLNVSANASANTFQITALNCNIPTINIDTSNMTNSFAPISYN